MERAYHERLIEGRITRSRARSLERQLEKSKGKPPTPPSPPDHPPPLLPSSAEQANPFQAEKLSAAVQPEKANELSDGRAAAVVPPVQKVAAVARPQSLAEELAQARKEEGGETEFAGETQQTPAPLRTRKPSKRIAVKAIPLAPPPRPPTSAAVSAEEEKEQEPPAAPQHRPPLSLSSHEDETKEGKSSFWALKEDTRDLFSASSASPSLPPSPSPSSKRRSPTSTSAFPPIFERHEAALLPSSDLPPSELSSFGASLDDKSLAWQLQQEEYEAASMAPRHLRAFLADLAYQPAWLRLSLSAFLVINVLLALLFLPRLDALVTLTCGLLTLASGYALYRVYDFTPYLFYSTALLLPSLIHLVDVHVLHTSVEDLSTLFSSFCSHPSLLLDPVVWVYAWRWATTLLQTYCLVGGMWLALKVR